MKKLRLFSNSRIQKELSSIDNQVYPAHIRLLLTSKSVLGIISIIYTQRGVSIGSISNTKPKFARFGKLNKELINGLDHTATLNSETWIIYPK